MSKTRRERVERLPRMVYCRRLKTQEPPARKSENRHRANVRACVNVLFSERKQKEKIWQQEKCLPGSYVSQVHAVVLLTCVLGRWVCCGTTARRWWGKGRGRKGRSGRGALGGGGGAAVLNDRAQPTAKCGSVRRQRPGRKSGAGSARRAPGQPGRWGGEAWQGCYTGRYGGSPWGSGVLNGEACGGKVA